MEQEIDLNKIAEFMNSEPEDDVNINEVENTLDYIDTQLATVKKETKEITTEEEAVKQETTIEDLTQVALKQLGKVDKNTDEIYQLFYTPIALKQDRTDASKNALIESQRLKIEMINALAALAQAKAKLEMAKSKLTTGNVGVFVGSMDQGQAGINLHNLWESTKE